MQSQHREKSKIKSATRILVSPRSRVVLMSYDTFSEDSAALSINSEGFFANKRGDSFSLARGKIE